MPFCLSAFADLAFDEHIHYMLGQFSPDNPITNTFLTVNGAEGVVEVGQHGSELWVRHVAGQPPIVRRGEMQLTVEDDASMVLQPDDEISLGATAEPILVTLVGQSRRSILGWLRALGSSFLPVAAPPSLLSARSPSPPHDEPAATDDPTDASETTGLSALTPAPPRFGEASTASVAADPTGSGAPYTYRTPAHPQPRAGALGVGGAPREASHGSETTCGSSHETAALPRPRFGAADREAQTDLTGCSPSDDVATEEAAAAAAAPPLANLQTKTQSLTLEMYDSGTTTAASSATQLVTEWINAGDPIPAIAEQVKLVGRDGVFEVLRTEPPSRSRSLIQPLVPTGRLEHFELRYALCDPNSNDTVWRVDLTSSAVGSLFVRGCSLYASQFSPELLSSVY